MTTDSIVKTRTRVDVKIPSNYKVIYINDEVTTMDFVIETLTAIFNLTRESAEELVYKIHTDGSAVVAVLPYEMAEQKGIEVTMLARQHGFPLVVKLEIEE
jgi:ATP-dependent Clp protease adaptor protein ClpS